MSRRAERLRVRRPRILTPLAGAIPELLGAAGDAAPAAPGPILRAELTSTGMAVMILGHAPDAPAVVVKVATTGAAAAGLARETHVLAQLAADDRLGDWRALVPRRLAQSTLLDHPCALDAALPGRSPRLRGGREAEAVRLHAARAIGRLHDATGAPLTIGDDVLRRWVERPAEEVTRHVAVGCPRRAEALERLADELCAALRGRVVRASWIHGDFWAGNLLVGRGGGITGIVDWDAAEPDEPALHDVLHPRLYGRRAGAARELGEIVCRQLAGGRAAERERALFHDSTAGDVDYREALLLYWLRHAALHVRQQERHDSPRHRLWQLRNLDPVLGRL